MHYDTTFDIWKVVMLYTLSLNAAIYLLLGISAALVHHRAMMRVLLIAFAVAVFGLLSAAGMAAVTTLLLAAFYTTLDARMSSLEALIFGCGQGVFIALLNAGFFHRVF